MKGLLMWRTARFVAGWRPWGRISLAVTLEPSTGKVAAQLVGCCDWETVDVSVYLSRKGVHRLLDDAARSLIRRLAVAHAEATSPASGMWSARGDDGVIVTRQGEIL